MNNFYDYSKQIHNHILTKALHPYLRRFLYDPVIEENKLLLLILLISELDISDEERDQYITATMLIQTALDIHDHVTVTSVKGKPELLKDRQLTVLAGDYYSGLYYSILAQIKNIDLIRALAEGTKEINQQKIMYHEHHHTDEVQLLETLQTIESSLIKKVKECFHIEFNDRFIEQYLLLNRLEIECKLYEEQQPSHVFERFANTMFSKNLEDLSQIEKGSIVSAMNEHVKNIRQACVEELNRLSPTKANSLALFKTTLLENELKVNSVAEEG